MLVLAEDLTDDGAGARIAEAVRARHGRLDLLVNNAGAGWRGTFADGSTANLRQTVELNLFAQAALTEALLPLLRESAPSAIVNVASTSGRVAGAGAGAYSASKFGLIGWSDALHMEERPQWCSCRDRQPGLRGDRGLSAGRARRQGRDALDGVDAREGGRSDRRRRPRRQGRALRATALRARGGRPDPLARAHPQGAGRRRCEGACDLDGRRRGGPSAQPAESVAGAVPTALPDWH